MHSANKPSLSVMRDRDHADDARALPVTGLLWLAGSECQWPVAVGPGRPGITCGSTGTHWQATSSSRRAAARQCSVGCPVLAWRRHGATTSGPGRRSDPGRRGEVVPRRPA
jgi:hypothetical protein